jgi:hypothetical protein
VPEAAAARVVLGMRFGVGDAIALAHDRAAAGGRP